ncbi:EEF1A lysine methyltransferase 2 [Aplysia californica]|uniref:Protein-lysine N-methyltransferase LOC101862639 n=1 Tax=Aplysia californica TaxID=6500 RepID=A0ABM0JKN2_APLCA|nr:EEF1A lysine methyltransferase 2 [Aplysia californica]
MEKQNDADFESSELGTKQYWDDTYARELEAFGDVGDVGEIWFGEEVQDRMVRWLTKQEEVLVSSRILDLGCGNGMLLLALREEGYENLVGVDYSEGAIQLAKQVAEKEELQGVEFQVCDILASTAVEGLCAGGKFDVCLDKGTYDAICLLRPEVTTDRDMYRQHVHAALRPGGLLLLTSCNWTKEQLTQHFEADFDLMDELPAPKFTFGGQTGQTVTSLAFRKR